MAAPDDSLVPAPSPEHRRIVAAQFERANQVIATGNYDYGIQLLLNCCKLDPANLIYRQALRQTEKVKYQNNLKGSKLSLLTNSAAKAKLLAYKKTKDHLKVLEYGEEVLTRNPWDTGVQLDMADAAEALGLKDLAIWTLEQARQKNPKDVTVNRWLARLYEQRGNFTHAINLWELIRAADPLDPEAQNKAKDLAANQTIARNQGRRLGTEAAAETAPAKDEPPASEDGAARVPGDRVAHEAVALRGRIQADPTNPNAYLHLAGLYRRAAQLEQARQVLQEGLGPTGQDFDLTVELADLDLEPFRRNLAITEERLRQNAADENLRKIRIRLLKEINTRELDLFRQKADRYPTEKGFRFELGVRLLRAQQLDEAIRELQGVRSDPRYQWKALLYLGFCFKNRHNWRLAQRNFEEALKDLPAGEEDWRKEILFQLAQGAADSGDLAKAVDLAHELANLDFGYHGIGQLMDEWEERMHQADSAQ